MFDTSSFDITCSALGAPKDIYKKIFSSILTLLWRNDVDYLVSSSFTGVFVLSCRDLWAELVSMIESTCPVLPTAFKVSWLCLLFLFSHPLASCFVWLALGRISLSFTLSSILLTSFDTHPTADTWKSHWHWLPCLASPAPAYVCHLFLFVQTETPLLTVISCTNWFYPVL